jgi:hypothetical protein
MACNIGMDNQKHPDAALIESLGGAAEVARLLGLDPSAGGVQRVHNWTTRGIPPLLRYQRTDVFGPTPADQAQAA